MTPKASSERTWFRVAVAAFVLGLGLQVWLWSRAWIDWDQIVLLKLGMKLVLDGELAIFGKIMSGGGLIPGSFLQLLVAGPLALWFDYRSPGLLVVVSQALAGVVLWRVVARGFGERTGAVFLCVYWLSPWRLYHSGFIWEPNYLLLPAALHLWALFSQRDGPRFFASAVLGGVLLVSPQIHASGVALLVVTVLWLLLMRRQWRSTWSFTGLATGALIGALSLIPTAIGLARGLWPDRSPGLPGTGFLTVAPVLKAAAYWIRLGTLDIGRRLRQVVASGAAEWSVSALQVASVLSVLVGLFATVWYFRQRSAGSTDDPGTGEFFYRYVGVSAVGLLISAGLSPATIQGWHTLVVLHAATIPVALFSERHFFTGASWVRGVVAVFLFLRLPIVVALGLGHPMYVIPHHDPEEMQKVEAQNLPEIEPRKLEFGSGEGAEPLFRGIDLWD